MAVQNDERRAPLRLSKDFQRLFNALTIVSVANPQDIPAIRQEASRNILGECQARAAFDRDVVVVVDPAEVVEAQVTGQRCRFMRNALHQAAITTDRINVVIKDVESGLVVAAREPLPRDCHPNTSRNALPQWPGCGFDSRHPVVLGVTRRLAVQLAEPANVVERHRGLPEPFIFSVHGACPAEMESRPEQHRSMAVREYKAIPIRPDRILRIEAQHPVPDRIDQRRKRHRRAGMARLGLLHCIDRKRANCVDAQLTRFRVARGRYDL